MTFLTKLKAKVKKDTYIDIDTVVSHYYQDNESDKTKEHIACIETTRKIESNDEARSIAVYANKPGYMFYELKNIVHIKDNLYFLFWTSDISCD